MEKVPTLKFDDGANAAVRANNEELCSSVAVARLETDEPVPGDNLRIMRDQMGADKEPSGSEYSVFGYKGSSAEEFVALLLYQDFDKFATQVQTDEKKAESGEPDQEKAPDVNTVAKSGLLDPTSFAVGISNKPHSKCTNSIQVVVLKSVANAMA